jgi:hypothetical protein
MVTIYCTPTLLLKRNKIIRLQVLLAKRIYDNAELELNLLLGLPWNCQVFCYF